MWTRPCHDRPLRRQYNRWPALIIGLVLWTASLPALAQQPLDAVRQHIGAGIRILNDPYYQQPAHRSQQLLKLQQIVRDIFDFREFSRRVLASHWKKFTPRQQKKFVAAFGAFLEKFYLPRLQARYNGKHARYLSQQMIGSEKALVAIRVFWRDKEIPVALRMTRRSGLWKVYDIGVLGISAVRIYRAQFRAILEHESPGQVITRLKRKLAALGSMSP